MNKKFVLTTPLYYTNAPPHCGHAYTTIAADVIARYHRSIGDDVFFLTGTDENAGKVAEAAKKQGRQPKEFVDEIAGEFKKAWKDLNITHDGFIRTTDKKHWKFVQRFLQRIYDDRDIYKGEYKGLYCQACEKFLKESDLVDGLCPDHKIPPKPYSEENYFFRLSKYQTQIEKLIETEEIQVLPKERENEILGKLKLGLEDLSISRANVDWGIPLPFDKSQRCYCWIEALQGYISGMPKNYWPADLHLMARDITWFHAVIWPALLLAADYPLPRKIFSHGFFTVEGQKMSKTIGNIIVPDELIEKFGIDGTRYLMLTEIPFGKDGDISIKRFVGRYNADLANGLGNLFARVATLAQKYFGGRVPKAESPYKEPRIELIQRGELVWEKYYKSLEIFRFDEALTAVWEFIQACDKYIDETEPWLLAKSEQKEKLAQIVYNLLECLHQIAWLIYPFITQTAREVGKKLSIETLLADRPDAKNANEPIKPGLKISVGKPLFPRI